MGQSKPERSRMLSLLVAISLAAAPSAVPAFATEQHQFNVVPLDARSAVRDFAAQAKIQILVAGEYVQNRKLNTVTGNLSTDAALTQLLQGTGLTHRYVSDGTVALVESTDAAQDVATTGALQPADVATPPESRSFSKRIRLAQATQRAGAEAASPTPTSASLEEIVVSAQKQGDQRLQEVPIPISVLNADVLAGRGQVSLRDFFSSVPALAVSPNYGLAQQISIRGISTGGFNNPTVSVLVDDIPFGASTNAGDGTRIPDIDPGDLARIEVLRGPQGTLYGASSMGGLIRYVTKEPSFDGYSGRLEMGTNKVKAGDTGYNLRGSINAPLGETLALRLSAFQRHDAGYIDNPTHSLEDVNDGDVTGARATALWQPADIFSLRLSAFYQHARANGVSEVVVTPGLGDLDQNYVPGVGWSRRTFQSYSATARLDPGAVEITSLTGYNDGDATTTFDRTTLAGNAILADFGPGLSGAFIQEAPLKKFVQELRFSGSLDDRIDWLLGAFYTDENTDGTNLVLAADSASGQIVGEEGFLSFPRDLEETAVFANLTYRFTDRWDVQLGVRQSEIEQVFHPALTRGGSLFFNRTQFPNGGQSLSTTVTSNEDAFTYSVVPRFRITPDLMVFARFATGYRPGGPNNQFVTAAGQIPQQYDPDRTTNYELGLKGGFFDGRLNIDTSLYRIDWDDIQLQVRVLPFTFTTNAATARSQGVELSFDVHPTDNLTISGWTSYNDAELAEDFPGTATLHGEKGERLALAPEWSGRLSAEQQFPIGPDATAYVSAAWTYIGDRLTEFRGFTGTPAVPLPRQVLDSYSTVDLGAGVNWSTWAFNLYANNVTDERGMLGGGLAFQPQNAFLYIQPRTVGLSVVRSF